MDEPREFRKSLVLSGALNVFVFLLVGIPVVLRWGYDVGEVIGITAGVGAWTSGAGINTAFNSFQLLGNFVSYMLDSVPLGRFCQKSWAPDFQDTWAAGDVLRYLGYTLPTFLFALFLSIAVPSVNTLLDFSTALTVPWVTQIYPAVCYWRLRQRDSKPAPLEVGNMEIDAVVKPIRTDEKVVIFYVYTVGLISFVLCSVKAVGYVYFTELRPPWQIGCGSWLIWEG